MNVYFHTFGCKANQYDTELVRQAFAEGRGIIDFGVERLQRSGGGLEERVWTFLLGLTIRP